MKEFLAKEIAKRVTPEKKKVLLKQFKEKYKDHPEREKLIREMRKMLGIDDEDEEQD